MSSEKKIQIIKAKDLSEEQRDEFSEAFYDLPGAPDDADGYIPCPWGCPWFFGFECELRGASIEEMAKNYFDDNIEEINALLLEEQAELVREKKHKD